MGLQRNAFFWIDLARQANKAVYAHDDPEVVFSDRRGAVKSGAGHVGKRKLSGLDSSRSLGKNEGTLNGVLQFGQEYKKTMVKRERR